MWQETLRQSQVDNLWEIPEFRRFCSPPREEPPDGHEPGLVIEFPSTIQADLNFFGWPGSAGEGARRYNPTYRATRVLSVGIWFSNYDSTTRGLNPDPYAWLVPVGADILRVPGSDSFEFRYWQVVEQDLPLPDSLQGILIGALPIDWIPIENALDGTYAKVRRYNAVDVSHDDPLNQLSTAKVTSDSFLVGRSVANTRWMLIIPGVALLGDEPDEGLRRFINGPLRSDGNGYTGDGVSDIKIYFETLHHTGAF
jgi:hypothetical protein